LGQPSRAESLNIAIRHRHAHDRSRHTSTRRLMDAAADCLDYRLKLIVASSELKNSRFKSCATAGTASDVTRPFGGAPYCNYSVTFSGTQLSFTVDPNTNTPTSTTIQTQMTEIEGLPLPANPLESAPVYVDVRGACG